MIKSMKKLYDPNGIEPATSLLVGLFLDQPCHRISNFKIAVTDILNGRIILRWIFREWEGVVGTGWSWLRLGTVGGHL